MALGLDGDGRHARVVRQVADDLGAGGLLRGHAEAGGEVGAQRVAHRDDVRLDGLGCGVGGGRVERERVQAFEGVCIARAGGGVNETFTVRKISFGEGVERVFPLYSPNVDTVTVIRRGAVRRAKLYYLRGRTGKSARIAERRDNRPAKDSAKAEKAD